MMPDDTPAHNVGCGTGPSAREWTSGENRRHGKAPFAASGTIKLHAAFVSKAMDWIDHLQWPAMVATLSSAWLVAAQERPARKWGFWIFLVSNALWITWSIYAHAYALIVLQIGLAFLNLRGVSKNE